MNPSDALRKLDCWLWRIDPVTGQVETLGGSNPLGPAVAGWRSLLRRFAPDDRRAILAAARAQQAPGAAGGGQRIDGIELPAAAGHRPQIDLLLGRAPASSAAEDARSAKVAEDAAENAAEYAAEEATDGGKTRQAWIGIAWRQSQAASGLGRPTSEVALLLDEVGLGWWSLDSVEHGVSLSRTAARLMGLGDAACQVSLAIWLSRAAPIDYLRWLQQLEAMLDGELDRFEIDLHDAPPLAGRAGLHITGLRARGPGNELIGVVQTIVTAAAAAPTVHADRAVAAMLQPLPAGEPSGEDGKLTVLGMDRESLVREIHHQIKNHLQGMTGLIERYRSDYPGLGGALDAIGGQLHSIGTVYGLLARSGRSDLALDEVADAVIDGLRGIARGDIVTRFPDAIAAWRIAEQHCVAVALVINELMMNAIKHGKVGVDKVLVGVEYVVTAQECSLCIRNPGALPAAFDYSAGRGVRTGLQLVSAMLPVRGAALSIEAENGVVEVRLQLAPPVLVLVPVLAPVLVPVLAPPETVRPVRPQSIARVD